MHSSILLAGSHSPESSLSPNGAAMALTQFRGYRGLIEERGHVALGQWINMGEPDKSGLALGARGECTEQYLDVCVTGKLVWPF